MNATVASFSLVLFALCCAPLPTHAQQPSAPGIATPSASNVPGASTPAIHPDRSITFTLHAPEASTLAVAGGDGLGASPFPMTKGTDGTWSVTTPPAVPGFHYYWFVLDGVPVNDPASRAYFGYGKETGAV
jgi:1,4-alpha-glucan branching enzyme